MRYEFGNSSDLAEERVLDARSLLDAGRWSAAYYIAGYAAECGLKACILAFLEHNLEVIFRERKYFDKCWVHELPVLVGSAGLDAALGAKLAGRAAFARTFRTSRANFRH